MNLLGETFFAHMLYIMSPYPPIFIDALSHWYWTIDGKFNPVILKLVKVKVVDLIARDQKLTHSKTR